MQTVILIKGRRFLFYVLVAACTSYFTDAYGQALPNIVLVMTDDQGKNDLACEGNPYIKTPNIDRFYSDAVRLTNFHVSTTCTPTRGALLTGRHTNRLNVYHTIAGRSILYDDEVLISQVLAQHGYTTGMFGKWHLGDNYPYRPEDRGFHEVLRHGGGGVGQGPDYWMNDYFDDTYWKNGELQKYEGYCTDVFFNEALDFIQENKARPFFCYISTNAPHGPLHCPEKYIDIYADSDLEERYQRFYGMITNIDDNFKRLENKLSDLDLTENTILIFMTDNGTAGGNQVYDAGMTGSKGSVMEGGHRVPFYIRWPKNGLQGGKDIDQLAAHYDVMPTLLDLAGLSHLPKKPLDGKSLVPLFNGRSSSWKNRILYVDTQREQNLTKFKSYSVMDEKWRLVNGTELFNIKEDLKQENNLFDKYPEVVMRLMDGYEKWWGSILSEKVDERYAYIKVGTENENPARIMSHDLLSGKAIKVWHQFHAITPQPASGIWKIEFVEGGRYRISLCRFPREAELPINAAFSAGDQPRRLARATPASEKTDFKEAYLYLGKYHETQKIKGGEAEVEFTVDISEGKYDVEAQLIDEAGRVYPAYYMYVEKVD